MSLLPNEWVIVGSGTLGRQVEAVLQAHAQQRGERVLGFLDDDGSKVGQEVVGLPILGPPEEWLSEHGRPVQVAMALGNPEFRRKGVEKIRSLEVGACFTPIIHPTSSVGPRVELGEGVILMAGVLCQCDLQIGAFSILGAGSSVSHDCEIGLCSWLSPGARLAGYARIGNECWIGMNASILGDVMIHDRAQVGAGCVVLHDVPEGEVVAGVPAVPTRLLRNRP
ncbi:MAG TPA: acetyltransferase [Holophagaceae bacterium]|nr:acetyltransferase [Holophagaceae bacterium]